MKPNSPVFKSGDRVQLIEKLRSFNKGELGTVSEYYETEYGYNLAEVVFDSKKENGAYLVTADKLVHCTKNFTPDEKKENVSIWDEFAD